MNTLVQGEAKEVWVIDDDETALMLAGEVLVSSGFKVRTFAGATEALAASASSFPDIFVVDLIMPTMDGFRFCELLRGRPGGEAVPILVTTSLDDVASIDRAYQFGATGFATKPINWGMGIHQLRYLLRGAEVARELREKEHETRMAKEDWERTFNSISDVVMVLDREMLVMRANSSAAKLFEQSVGELLGQHCCKLFNPDGLCCTDCLVAKTIKTGQPASAEINYQPKDIIFAVSTSPVTDPEGQLTHIVFIARDLSDQKRLEAEYRQAQKMEAIGTLAGGIAHDFNNLLTVVIGCGELLADEEEQAGRNRPEFRTIIDAAKRGAALSRQLMTFSRREACKSQMRTLDLNHVIREAWKMLQHIVSKTVTIRARLEENLDSINGDAGQLEQVLINLAVNSSHAMPNGGSLTVRTALAQLSEEDCRLHPDVKPGNYVVMTVTDTGHGMDKQTQERIYEPFFTTKTVGAGTGLGLSVVFGIVKDHQGHIVCDSEVNVGTTFKIYLPVATQVQKGQPTERSLDHASLAGHERIMVVDDEAPIRKMLERFLTKLGYSVFIAADGPTALQHYAQAEVLPDLIIMDLGMPMMNGWECLEKFRSLDRHVKILIATGYGGDDLEARVLSKGAIGLINKPYNPSGICRKMRDIFDASAAVKAAEGSTPTAGG